MDLEVIFNKYKVDALYGRYITLAEIEPVLQQLNTNNQLDIVGYSVLNKPIYSYKIGEGKIKIFLWSQMHGNESTTTKALFDFLNLLQNDSDIGTDLLRNFTFYCLPMVNPDGAQLYTRENANLVDLNRDAQNLTQPESKVLRACFNEFKPDYCYNLHDQRTIFGVGSTGKPATVSFLAPSFNEEREINDVRTKAINVIVDMNDALQRFIPKQVGRFDDSFNINCIGDTMQALNVPTILIEAGHFPLDYDREQTRKYIFIALLLGFKQFTENVIVGNKIEDYLNISQNKPVFYDFVYKNIQINYDSNKIITNIAIQFKEELFDNKIHFNAFIVKIGELKDYFGHFEYDAHGAIYSDKNGNIPQLNQKADFYLNENLEIVNGVLKIK
ncbi:M14 family metallopeptidase [Flavobacterium psychrotolerans]|uniref:Peptidase M14 n=1 Tax=Flavobacterium psychrotolerans TaxID=2169410 RepID=A0A2U1JHV3_9FLAO|nr:M14 metallopeptidase family protein [Flavobacterium psychrotolerans]PWA04726.1 peptidase M14 [Flavobacterium psychrotolerans]